MNVVVWGNGTYKFCNNLDAEQYQNDKDWLVTIELAQEAAIQKIIEMGRQSLSPHEFEKLEGVMQNIKDARHITADQPASCEGCEHHYHSFPTKEKHPCYNCNDFSNYQPK